MDIQADKLQPIEWIARLNDVKVIQIKSLKEEADKNLFQRYTEQDLVIRAEASIQDIEAGRTSKLSDIKTEIESWKQSRGTR